MKKNKFIIIILVIITVLTFKTALSDYIDSNSNSVTVVSSNPAIYNVDVSTGTGCTSSGGGSVSQGGSFTVSIGSSTGYDISALSIDGVNQGAWGSSVTFSNVSANHTVGLTCSLINYLVDKSAGAGGSISLPNGLVNQLVAYGNTLTATITPNSGYSISTVSGCNGTRSGNSYTTGSITSSCTITASFVANPVDGGWSAWSSWGACSLSCGGGTQSHTRTCTNPTPANGGASCVGVSTESQSCNTQACPVNCVGFWTDMSTCSASCNGGVLQQMYSITTPASNGGTACPYSNGSIRLGTTSCNTQACPPASCSSPCGTISSGSSCTAYAASSVAYPSTCFSQSRTCSNGSLSGTYSYSSCVVNATTPTVSTTAISSITSTSATSGGNVTSNGGSTVTVSGIVWHVNANPTVSLYTGKTTDGWASGSWSDNMTGLTCATTYHVRAYATNNAGTAYGSDVSFTTSACASVPTVTTNSISSITQTSASGGGNVTSNGGSTVTVSGIVWHVNANPTVSLYTGKTTDGWASGSWSDSITGLSCGTTYHVRAYATNSAGTAYGSDASFTTSACTSSPTVTTNSVTSVTQDSAVSGGNVTSNGGSTVTVSGIVWGTSANPTISSYIGITTDGWASGSWSDNITGLSHGTTYYVRAYATNSAGTSYGANISFTTDTYSGEVTIYKNELKTFSFVGTDPDGDTVIYGVDFNNNGTPDAWTSPYTSSGTTMFLPNSWSSIGTYYIKALTKDSRGDVSNWSQLFKVNVIENPNPAEILSFTVDKNKIDPGQAIKLTWTSQNATSCTMSSSPLPSVNLDSLGVSTTNNNITFKPLKTTIYSLVCHGPGGDSPVSQLTVTVGKIKPTLNEF